MAMPRSSRACMICAIVQSQKQFVQNGCPNCESYLPMAGSVDTVLEVTSQLFEGTLTLADPKTSWVAKWLRLNTYVPSVYAIKVVGSLPEDLIATLSDNGIRYIPRDGSEPEDAEEAE